MEKIWSCITPFMFHYVVVVGVMGLMVCASARLLAERSSPAFGWLLP